MHHSHPVPGQARLGDLGQALADAHSCTLCPHQAVGPAISGSLTVNVNGRPAIRVGDVGIHAACCGSNMWTALLGSGTVFINGRKAHRMNDAQSHCGGNGQMVQGSPDVIVGDGGGGGGGGGGNGVGGASAGAGGGGVSPEAKAAAPVVPANGTGRMNLAPPARTEAVELPAVVFAARWERPAGRFSAPIKLLASCANAAGKPATFKIHDADDPGGAPLATITATCGADSVEASWTVHDGPEPQELVFDVEVDRDVAHSGRHALLVTAEGKLTIDDKAAGGVDLVL